jgi:hypothetical protein
MSHNKPLPLYNSPNNEKTLDGHKTTEHDSYSTTLTQKATCSPGGGLAQPQTQTGLRDNLRESAQVPRSPEGSSGMGQGSEESSGRETLLQRTMNERKRVKQTGWNDHGYKLTPLSISTPSLIQHIHTTPSNLGVQAKIWGPCSVNVDSLS